MPSSTLPARYFTDPELFRRELDAFYFGRWICAGRTEFVPKPGDYFLREIAGESVIVLREGGGLRAFYNVCRHRGTRLCDEAEGCFGERIQCLYHGWTYSLDGRLVGAPHMNPGFQRQDYPLHAVHAAVWDGHIFLNFGENPQRLELQLGPLPDKFAAWCMQELRLHRRITYDVKANWKLVVLNFNECLHCPRVHPALNRLTDYLGADNEPANGNYCGGSMGFRGGAETMSMDGQRRREYLPGLDEGQRRQVYYYSI